MKIGIMTYHRACNYGAYLQACALCSRLNREQGIDAEIIDYRMQKEKIFYSQKRWTLKQKIRNFPSYIFLKKIYKTFEKLTFNDEQMKLSHFSLISDDVGAFTDLVRNKYDLIIAGSDEIWKIDGFRGFPTPYWLIGDLGCIKVSYAASSRSDFSKLAEKDRSLLKSILNDFQIIGVRDTLTKTEIQALDDELPVRLCCDPTFVHEFSIPSVAMTELLRGKAKLCDSKPNVVVMTENPQIAKEVRKQLKDKFNLISVFHWNMGYQNVSDLTPVEWLKVIKNADYVITSYFHATCFCMKFKTNFLALATSDKGDKVREVIKDSHLDNFFIENAISSLKNIDIEAKMRNNLEDEKIDHYIKRQNVKFDEFIADVKEIVIKNEN